MHPTPPMNLYLPQDGMSNSLLFTSAPKRSLPPKSIPLDQASDYNDVNFLTQQQPRSQQYQFQKAMSYVTRPDLSSFGVADHSTITTQGHPQPHHSFGPWQNNRANNALAAEHNQRGLPINVEHPQSWDQCWLYPATPNDNALASMVGNYSQNPHIGSSLVPYDLSQLSPTISDPALSPMYSTSPSLSTPSTPARSLRPYSTSPVLGRSGASDNSINQAQDDDASANAQKTQFTHREQLVKFREVFSLPMEGPGAFIPQKMYKPHTTSDRKRYVEEVLLEAPLFFYSDGPARYGVSLKDAVQSRTKKLLNRDQVVFEGRGPSVSIRLEWPGYRPWSRQIPTKDFRNPPGPITLSKLAKNVAKCVLRFVQDRKGTAMEEDADPRWRIGDGPNDIKLEDLVLVSMHHVSLGSWQPQLWLVRPREQKFSNNSLLLNPFPNPNTIPLTYRPSR